MADANLKVSENVAGKWYVDENCIACDSCISIAPDHFAMNEDSSHAYLQSSRRTRKRSSSAKTPKPPVPQTLSATTPSRSAAGMKVPVCGIAGPGYKSGPLFI